MIDFYQHLVLLPLVRFEEQLDEAKNMVKKYVFNHATKIFSEIIKLYQFVADDLAADKINLIKEILTKTEEL